MPAGGRWKGGGIVNGVDQLYSGAISGSGPCVGVVLGMQGGGVPKFVYGSGYVARHGDVNTWLW
jgi:hypothetical protein